MTKLNLYLISQNVNNDYNTYDKAVVAAPNEEAARNIHPGWEDMADAGREFSTWCIAEQVNVELIGEATEDATQCVICASFRAG